jgi:hypothetical protein
MKYFVYTVFFSICFIPLNAQNCLPDSTLKDSSAGVYPKPITLENPNGGIHKKACKNQDYSFVFTVVIPDSIVVPISPNPIPLEKVTLTTKDAIKNLPKGIEYACNPPNCIFKKNTIGCLELKGIPDNSNMPGDYKPVILMLFTVNLGFPIDLAAEYPGTTFPGEYILTLLSEQDCLIATKNESDKLNFWHPNPTAEFLKFSGQDVSHIRLYNAEGLLLTNHFTIKDNQIDLPVNLVNGIYLLSWYTSGKLHYQKIAILK